MVEAFDYIAVSPKDKEVAERFSNIYFRFRARNYWFSRRHVDIKVVTDLETVGIDMLPFATMLMPLTTYNKKHDISIRQRVWKFCTDNKLFYSGRMHIEVWGQKRKI